MAQPIANQDSKNRTIQTQTIGPAKKYTNTMKANATTKDKRATIPITSLTLLRSVIYYYIELDGIAFLITAASSKFAGTHIFP